MADDIANFVREEWTWSGVEVESTTDNMVRCRMPPFFSDVHGFFATVDDNDLVADMETSCHQGVASVVFVLYPNPNKKRGRFKSEPRGNDAVGRPPVSACVLAIVLLQCVLLAVCNPWGWKKIARALNVTG